MAHRPGAAGWRIADLAFAAAVVAAFVLAAHSLFRKITWYLAIDQYGYLTFAGDLAAGRIFHRWPPVDALVDLIAHPRVDVLSQTYVFDGERMYCRYSPGFPVLLAAWIRVFGADSAHYLDPILFLVLLAVCLELTRRLFAALPGARWLGLACVLLLLLLPSYLHLWAITILRDIPAQLFAFTALVAALPGSRPLSRSRAAVVGCIAGYLVTIRIDAVLYGLPIGTLLLAQPRRRAALAVACVTAAVGVAPLLVYNHLATGHALRPTQGMEMDRFLDPGGRAAAVPAPNGLPDRGRLRRRAREGGDAEGRPAGAVLARRAAGDRDRIASAPPAPAGRRGSRARALPPVQGGGLRLANLRRTLPGNAAYVRDAMGPVLLTLAALGVASGVVVPGVRRAVLLCAPYSALALIFFSFWGRADPRYIAGVLLFGPILALAGFASVLALAGFARAPALARFARAPVLARFARVPVLARFARVPVLAGFARAPALARFARVPVLARFARVPALASSRPRGSDPPAPVAARWLRPVLTALAVLALALASGWHEAIGEAWADVREAWAAGRWQGGSALPVVGGGTAALLILAAVTKSIARRPAASGWPAVALAVFLLIVAVARVIPTFGRPPVPFQGPRGMPDVDRARRTVEAAIEPGAVVITTMEVGRPAENIDHYTHAHALYTTDLERWGIALPVASARFVAAGHAVYLLVPSASPEGQEAIAALSGGGAAVRHLAHVAPADALRYFVASRLGAPALDLYRVGAPEDRERDVGTMPRAHE